jgi:sec-independent protein translocase protein TatC
MTTEPKDELEGTEAPFVSHLIELRDRLVRALIAIGVAFAILAAYPGPGAMYDLLAAPLLR